MCHRVLLQPGKLRLGENRKRDKYLKNLTLDNEQCYKHYLEALDDEVAKEIARNGLNLNIYSQYYWQQNLRNLFNLVHLRTDPHAQYETRVFATAMSRCIEAVAPVAFASFMNNIVHGKRFTKTECLVLKSLINKC